MLKFAILKPAYGEEGELIGFKPVFEGEDGDIEREIASRIRRILGPKKSYTGSEIDRAITKAFESYEKDFKEQTIKLK